MKLRSVKKLRKSAFSARKMKWRPDLLIYVSRKSKTSALSFSASLSSENASTSWSLQEWQCKRKSKSTSARSRSKSRASCRKSARWRAKRLAR